MSNHHVTTTVLFSLLAMTTAAYALGIGGRSGNLVGGYKPIKNLSDPYVVGIAKFAINEHNKQTKEHLQLVRIVKGESQVVSGTNYRLTIAASDSKQYEVSVFDQPWTHKRTLMSFRPVS